jgi:selenocysteine lyase/cysteine desulfurase
VVRHRFRIAAGWAVVLVMTVFSVKTVIDGAQAVGVFPVDAGAINADFYSGSLHKWLMGPAGVGFLMSAP